MITLVGVGHVFDIGKQIERIIEDIKPDIVAVELDTARMHALIQKEKRRKKNVPVIYRLLALLQSIIAKRYDVSVGSEMLSAITTAKKQNIPIECIDMDSVTLFLRMWQSMSFSEKIKLLTGSFTGVFMRKKTIERELKKIETDYNETIEKFGDVFPIMKKILIDERNEYMANKITNMYEQHKNIVAIVGDGHIDGIRELLLSHIDDKINIIRLSSLRTSSSCNTYRVGIEFNAGE